MPQNIKQPFVLLKFHRCKCYNQNNLCISFDGCNSFFLSSLLIFFFIEIGICNWSAQAKTKDGILIRTHKWHTIRNNFWLALRANFSFCWWYVFKNCNCSNRLSSLSPKMLHNNIVQIQAKLYGCKLLNWWCVVAIQWINNSRVISDNT